MPTKHWFHSGERVRIKATGEIGVIVETYPVGLISTAFVVSISRFHEVRVNEDEIEPVEEHHFYYSKDPQSKIHWSQVAPLKPMNISMSFESDPALLKTLADISESTRKKKERNEMRFPGIKKVYFNDPATIVLWCDGTKTVVKCSENDWYDPEKGLAMAILKKLWGNDNAYHQLFKKWCPKEEPMDYEGVEGLFAAIFESLAKAGYPIAKVDGVKKEGEDTVVECHYEED